MVQPDLSDQSVNTGFGVEALTPTLGARVRGIDLVDLDDEQFERLYAAWLEHKVLFIDPQSIDLDTLDSGEQRSGLYFAV